MVAVRRGRNYLLRKSPAGERWAGLWEFLRIPLERNGSDTLPAAVLEKGVASLCRLNVEMEPGGFEFRHTVTRFRIHLHCATARYVEGRPRGPGEYRWARAEEFAEFAFSMPARKFADRLSKTPARAR
jgi:adenine-specific DNA glycosylase